MTLWGCTEQSLRVSRAVYKLPCGPLCSGSRILGMVFSPRQTCLESYLQSCQLVLLTSAPNLQAWLYLDDGFGSQTNYSSVWAGHSS